MRSFYNNITLNNVMILKNKYILHLKLVVALCCLPNGIKTLQGLYPARCNYFPMLWSWKLFLMWRCVENIHPIYKLHHPPSILSGFACAERQFGMSAAARRCHRSGCSESGGHSSSTDAHFSAVLSGTATVTWLARNSNLIANSS